MNETYQIATSKVMSTISYLEVNKFQNQMSLYMAPHHQCLISMSQFPMVINCTRIPMSFSVSKYI